MAVVFKKFNEKQGFDQVCHTATGYRCLAKIVSPEDLGKKIYFFAKHIVGKDGRPYTEIGFESDEQFNKKEYIEKVKESLIAFGIKEVFAITNCVAGEQAFSSHATPYPNSIEFRIWAGKDGIALAFDALHELVSREAISFVREQEADVENILFASIMEAMGAELSRGPGGEQKALQKAKELTNYFLNGLQAV